MNRREFIQTGALSAAGLMTLPSVLEAKKKSAYGLQLYTLRDIIDSDVKGVLTQVAAMGYTETETYGYKEGKLFGLPVAEYGAFVKSIGLKTVSGHYGIDMTVNGWDKACEDAKSLGQSYVVVPWMDKKYYNTVDDLKKTCDQLNKAGEVARKYGLQFGYHNHAFEFEQVGDKTVFEHMLGLLDPKLVIWEMDIYWVVRAGHDPVTYFEKYPKRFPLWHVKDMDKSNNENNADVGTGSIDYKMLFTKAKQAGLKTWFMEQETYPSSSMESTRKSIEYLKTIR